MSVTSPSSRDDCLHDQDDDDLPAALRIGRRHHEAGHRDIDLRRAGAARIRCRPLLCSAIEVIDVTCPL